MFGYLLSLSGEYDAQTLSNHKTSGILLAVLSGLLWSMTTSFYSRFLAISNRAVAAVCAVVVILMAYTGHQGQTLHMEATTSRCRHSRTRSGQNQKHPMQAMIFEDVVQPLLEKRCLRLPQRKKAERGIDCYLLGSTHARREKAVRGNCQKTTRQRALPTHYP